MCICTQATHPCIQAHGWPSFRNEEVVWANMRVLSDGEAVSIDGTHLGHNLPDSKGNRYCMCAGEPSRPACDSHLHDCTPA